MNTFQNQVFLKFFSLNFAKACQVEWTIIEQLLLQIRYTFLYTICLPGTTLSIIRCCNCQVRPPDNIWPQIRSALSALHLQHRRELQLKYLDMPITQHHKYSLWRKGSEPWGSSPKVGKTLNSRLYLHWICTGAVVKLLVVCTHSLAKIPRLCYIIKSPQGAGDPLQEPHVGSNPAEQLLIQR